jgi:hypothetical protein
VPLHLDAERLRLGGPDTVGVDHINGCGDDFITIAKGSSQYNALLPLFG